MLFLNQTVLTLTYFTDHKACTLIKCKYCCWKPYRYLMYIYTYYDSSETINDNNNHRSTTAAT